MPTNEEIIRGFYTVFLKWIGEKSGNKEITENEYRNLQKPITRFKGL